MAFSNRVAQLDGLEIYTMTVLAERDADGNLRVVKVLADGVSVIREYGGVNEDKWVATNAAGQLIITVKEEH
jgi:hypothetical protein